MKYARIVNDIAVDVVTAPPATLFTPDLASQFTVVPDIEQGSVRLPVIVNDVPTLEREWHPPRTFVEEYEQGKFRHTQRATGPAVVFAADPAPRHITRLAFISRFTDAEAIVIDLASIGATQQAAAMRRYLNKVNTALYIDLDRADTRNGVLALQAGGLLANGRAAEILDAPIQDHEVFRE